MVIHASLTPNGPHRSSALLWPPVRTHPLVTAVPADPGRYAWLGCAGTGPPSALRLAGMRSVTMRGGG